MGQNLDCELGRLRVTSAMRDAIQAAAAQEGITPTAWRKRAIALALTRQLGGGWQKGVDHGS